MKENGMQEETRTENGPEAMSVEEAFEALDVLIGRLESGEGSLEDAFKNYEEGIKLIKSCNDKIDRIEKQILILSGEQTEEEDDEIRF